MLLDANILSEIQRPSGESRVKSAVALWEDDIHLSVIVLGEVIYGVERLPHSRRRTELQQFYARLRHRYASRILDVTEDVAEVWGTLTASLQARGRILPAADGLIAATALHHNMPLMTRNTSDFDLTGVRLINPWED